MCNRIDETNKIADIRRYGLGYKIFNRGMSSLFNYLQYLKKDNNKVIWWDKSTGGTLNNGFCFFINGEEAYRLLYYLQHKSYFSYRYTDCCVKRIKYFEGLGSVKKPIFNLELKEKDFSKFAVPIVTGKQQLNQIHLLQ